MYSLDLLAKLMVLLRQVLFDLAIAVIVVAMLVRISVQQVPFLPGVALRYLRLVTSSNFWPLPRSVYESVGEVLKFVTAVAHKINVVSES